MQVILAKQSQFFLKLKKPKPLLSAMTIYFRKNPISAREGDPSTEASTYEFCQSKPISALGLLAVHFAKQNRHERNELTPEDENVGSRRIPPLLGRAKET